MASHSHTPHFHNDLGLPTIRVGVKEFMCTGALPPADHPHVFIDMGDSDDAVCPYCSTHFVCDPGLGPHSEPPACEYRPDTAP